MAIFNPPTKASIRKEFTHVGWFGFCPVYIADVDSDGPTIIERNGIPQWWFEANELFLGACIWICSALNSEYKPNWPIQITGEIE
jgi:hypothetical protein